MKLIFATNNKHKLSEINHILSNKIELLSLNEIGFNEEIPETQPTIHGNAAQKAHYIYDRLNINCFADDTGLEVEALDGRPGVYSARYAGEKATYQENVIKLLGEMKDKTNRKARFVTVICLIIEGKEYFFEGIVNGSILKQQRGNNGFGYDPVFVPDGFDKTYAELDFDIKNKISHRALSTQKLIYFLNKL